MRSLPRTSSLVLGLALGSLSIALGNAVDLGASVPPAKAGSDESIVSLFRAPLTSEQSPERIAAEFDRILRARIESSGLAVQSLEVRAGNDEVWIQVRLRPRVRDAVHALMRPSGQFELGFDPDRAVAANLWTRVTDRLASFVAQLGPDAPPPVSRDLAFLTQDLPPLVGYEWRFVRVAPYAVDAIASASGPSSPLVTVGEHTYKLLAFGTRADTRFDQDSLRSAEIAPDHLGGQGLIIEFRDANAIREFSSRHVDHCVGVVIDDQLVVLPRIVSAFGPQAFVQSGGEPFPELELATWATMLGTEPLPGVPELVRVFER